MFEFMRFINALVRFSLWLVIPVGTVVVSAMAGVMVGLLVGRPDVGFGLGFALAIGAVVWMFRRKWADWRANPLGDNLYAILGVRQSADPATIRHAFKRLAQQHHPDRFPPEERAAATARFIRVNRAYELLSHPETRFQYDFMLEQDQGRIPPFDEVYERLADEARHPIFGLYDEWAANGVPTEEEVEQMWAETESSHGVPDDEEPTDFEGGDTQPEAPEPVPDEADCPACGHCYQPRRDRTAPAHCEQCGEELPLG